MEFIIADSVVAAVVVALFVYLVVTKKAVTTALTKVTSGEADAASAFFVPPTNCNAITAEVEGMRACSRAGKPFIRKLPFTETTDVGYGRKYIKVVQPRKQTHKNRKQARRRQN